MLTVPDYWIGLRRAILRGDLPVAKLCTGLIWKHTTVRDSYLKCKLIVLTCYTAYHLLPVMENFLSEGKVLSGKDMWSAVRWLCEAQHARDAFALAWFSSERPFVPYELGLFDQFGDKHSTFTVPITQYNATLIAAAKFLLDFRQQEDFSIFEPEDKIAAAKELPAWVTLKCRSEEIVKNVSFDLFVEEYSKGVEIIEPTVLWLKPTDNLLWTQYIAARCGEANMEFKELFKVARDEGWVT